MGDGAKLLSIGEVGDRLGVQAWRIARVMALGLVRDAPRVAGRRVLREEDVPDIADALRQRGWLPEANHDAD